ncbi:hypothetical protein CF319_g4059 [Tilletia indica]|uniref:Uncharacterized protein n=1 Tax=Tilletia indica TaxID=43049 RepID=A0A8T8SDP8_9BASI|nr:hypothetical protein CF319_g4059 [Tilletia indica]KAE8237847.1 hypothetical protein A4X13_0g8617 [Tilletia indica]
MFICTVDLLSTCLTFPSPVSSGVSRHAHSDGHVQASRCTAQHKDVQPNSSSVAQDMSESASSSSRISFSTCQPLSRSTDKSVLWVSHALMVVRAICVGLLVLYEIGIPKGIRVGVPPVCAALCAEGSIACVYRSLLGFGLAFIFSLVTTQYLISALDGKSHEESPLLKHKHEGSALDLKTEGFTAILSIILNVFLILLIPAYMCILEIRG